MTKHLTRYANANATPTMEAFADFLIAEVFGGTLPEGVDVASFRTGVALGGSTRGYFQASETWKNDPRNYLANVETNREKKATERAERAKEAARKASERAAIAVAKAEEIASKARARAEALANDDDAPNAATDATDAPKAPESAPEPTPEPTPETVRRSRRGPLGKRAETDDDAANAA